MKVGPVIALFAAFAPTPGAVRPLSAAPAAEVELVLQAGRPLRVAIDRRIRVKRVGQGVLGVLVEDVYSYDRVVVPAGTTVFGHVAGLPGVSRGTRARAIMSGDFTPLRRAVQEFDSLLLDDCREIPVRTEVRHATERLALQAREAPGKRGVGARARGEVAQRVTAAVSAVKQRGRTRRLLDAVVGRLPYHPQYLRAGTVYTAVLLSPVAFGTAVPTEGVRDGTVATSDSILHARLVTRLDSAKTPRGAPVQAVVTEPLFSADHRLILPEGTLLTGEVTFAKPARRFHRNGQLRFLFETAKPPEQAPAVLRASLYSVEASQGERLAVDDEGGVSATNSNARFVAPVLSTVALGVSLHGRMDYDTDGAPPELVYGTAETHGVGGYFGLGLLGAGLSQLSRPVSIGLGALGLARSVYSSVAGKGRDVSFPEHTVIEVQLAGAPPREK